MVSPVEGLSVAEPVFLQATLVATCQYQQGQIPVDGATILLKVTDLEPAFTRGIAVNGTTCPAAVVTTSQGVAQFDFEPGIRSIFTNLDSEGAPEFSLLEILAAETRIVGWSEDRFEWETIDSSTGKDLAIEPGEPFTIDWIHDPDLVIPTDTLMYLEYNLGQNATFQNGPEFVLLDEFNNVVVQWGKDDPQWHRDPQGEIFIQNPGTEGTPPWAGISFEPLSDPLFYNPIQFSSVFFTGTTAPGSYYGSTSWDVCVNTTENGTICSTWGVDNSGALNWI